MKNYTLPKDFGTKWIAALRSGEYHQTKGSLREYEFDEKHYCYCANGIGFIANGFELDMSTRVIIDGISISGSSNRTPIGSDIFEAIVQLNDDNGLSFPEIADWVESNVEFI